MNNIQGLNEKGISITEEGHAKINLALDVTGRLDNGYHLVKMIMESIELKDELTFTCSTRPGIRLMQTIQNGTKEGMEQLSAGEDNLIIKAARALLARSMEDISQVGLDIQLIKNIPMAAGMAGGSADAAATLRALNRLYDLGLSIEELCEIGVTLGADIPFCIREGSYLSEGIGEVLTPVSVPPKAYIALVKPPIDVSTKYVYEHLDSEGVPTHPDVDAMIANMEKGDLDSTAKLLGNVLRDVTIGKYPIVAELEDFLVARGAKGALMSGSGPTVFGLFADSMTCHKAVEEARELYPDMYVCETTWA